MHPSVIVLQQNKKKSFHLIFNPFRHTFNYILQMHVTQRVLQTLQNNKPNKHEDKLWNTALRSPGYTLLTVHNKYVVIFLDNIFVMIIVWWTIPLHGTQLIPCLLAAQSIAWWEMCGHTLDAPHETPCFSRAGFFLVHNDLRFKKKKDYLSVYWPLDSPLVWAMTGLPCINDSLGYSIKPKPSSSLFNRRKELFSFIMTTKFDLMLWWDLVDILEIPMSAGNGGGQIPEQKVSSHNLLQTQHWKLMYASSSVPRSGTVLHL